MSRTRARQLAAYIGANRNRAFRPGTFDCALFVAGWHEVLTGQDVAAGWRGTYRSLEAGRAALAEAGFDDLFALLSSHYEPRASWMTATPGDVAVLRDADQLALGIVGGRFIYVLRDVRGLGSVPLDRALKVYHP